MFFFHFLQVFRQSLSIFLSVFVCTLFKFNKCFSVCVPHIWLSTNIENALENLTKFNYFSSMLIPLFFFFNHMLDSLVKFFWIKFFIAKLLVTFIDSFQIFNSKYISNLTSILHALSIQSIIISIFPTIRYIVNPDF